jgi:hypothetical protein
VAEAAASIVVVGVVASTAEAAAVVTTAVVGAVSIAVVEMTVDADVTTVEIEGETVEIGETEGIAVTEAEIEAETVGAGVPAATIVAGGINFYCITLYTGYRRCAGS